MIWIICFVVSVLAIMKSLHILVTSASKQPGRLFSAHNLLFLCAIYITVLIAFGVCYVVLEETNLPILEEDGKDLHIHSIQIIEVCMYFSAITLLSVGYGDITPIGLGRWIAIVEALVGYTMPAAFFVHSVIEHDKTK